MSKNTSISLGAHYTEFIEAKLATGRFGSASEVVRAGLRLLEEHEMKVEKLRAALQEGEASGAAESFDPEAFLTDLHQAEIERRR